MCSTRGVGIIIFKVCVGRGVSPQYNGSGAPIQYIVLWNKRIRDTRLYNTRLQALYNIQAVDEGNYNNTLS